MLTPDFLYGFSLAAMKSNRGTRALAMVDYEAVIRVPYSTLPNFEKYHGRLFRMPPSAEHMVAKNNMLKDDHIYGKSWFETQTAIELDLAAKAADILGFEQRSTSQIGRNVSSIKDLALMMQEDVAILHQGRLEACCFMFPSGWAPEDKVGMSFAELHRPVADGERLRASADVITRLMCGEHCYHRYVWGLANSGMLSAHPRYNDKKQNIESINDIWFRYEHQITAPVEMGLTSLFTVDVQLVPYCSLAEGHRRRIVESVNSMSPNVLKYKKMAPFKKLLAAR